MYLIPFALCWGFLVKASQAYTPEVSHRHIAGLWKLTQKFFHEDSVSIQQRYPIKEFTVFPKDKEKQRQRQQRIESQHPSILLMLKENGEFEEYADDETKKDCIPEALRYHKAEDAVLDRYSAFGRLKGNWELVDGKLILAPDRPTNDTPSHTEDAVLEGEVVACSEEGLTENPALLSKHEDGSTKEKQSATKPSSSGASQAFDTHLSVPKGRINVGRFMYPKRHPYFFDTPMYNPISKGVFELKQVLGSLNTQQWKEEKQCEEKFKEASFYNKRFWLTSHPLKEHVPKGNRRWSIKYNRYVEDSPRKKQSSDETDGDKPVPTVNVLEVRFFSNNTFATVGGMGSSTILRGKFYVIGDNKDQLWMQVWRFGFGRSVSGSVYSEGTYLSQDDEKTYWGKIEYVAEEYEVDQGGDDEKQGGGAPVVSFDSQRLDENNNESKRLLVKGSVIIGGNGLEPQPIGRFIMTERVTAVTEENSATEEDDEDENDFPAARDMGSDISDDQPFFNSDDAFQ